MNVMLRVLVVWIMLLAVPFQGFASATMLPCAPTMQHDHESTTADGILAEHEHDAQAGLKTHPDHHLGSHHQGGKCANCASCGSCVAMAPSFLTVLPVHASSSLTVPSDQQVLLSVDLALPERPPRA
jgi:hypothetical protein